MEERINSHQWLVGKTKCNDSANKLGGEEIEIQKCKTFEEIFEIVESIKNSERGLGDLWSYDTALRIGFNKHFYPNQVYIQAGVAKGVKRVLINRPNGRSLPLSIFPNEFQMLLPYQAEIFLCIWGKY